MARTCVHFDCKYCGQQKICFSSVLLSEDVLTCSNGHAYMLTTDEREKINIAFKTFISSMVEVYL